jgi:hypothetical protein
MLEKCLIAHLHTSSTIKLKVLQILKKLPVSTKNAVLRCEALLEQLKDEQIYEQNVVALAIEVFYN